MTFQPILPPLLLALLAAAIVAGRVLALRRQTAAGRAALWRWTGLTLAALFLVAAAARPILGNEPGVTQVAGGDEPNVFLVVDRSPDMGVDARMAAARADAEALIDRYPNARFAVIAFASRPSLDWPLSQDTWSLRPVMSTLVPYASAPDAAAQTNVGAASTVLRYQLIGAVQQYPRAENLVYYLGAGEGGQDVPQREFELPAGAVDGGAVLGYGAGAGVQALQGVADQIGVPYLARDDSEPLADVLPEVAAEPTQAAGATTSDSRFELYWAFAAAAAALVLVELYLVLRELRRTRMAMADVTP